MEQTELITLENNSDLIQYFIDVIEAKDPYTQGHSHHVKAITDFIVDCLPLGLQAAIDKEKLLTAALLHDIGKIRTPDFVLNKNADNKVHVLQIPTFLLKMI